MKIAFIGLGNMGAPMATNLVSAGHDVIGVDPVSTPAGIPMAQSVSQACTDIELAITMLPDGEILKKVAIEALAALSAGTILLDCSTVDVDSTRHVASLAANAGIAALDAPVSGGTGGAANASLTFMVGGPSDAFTTVHPVLKAMGQRVVHCGDSGAGQAAKICNNMILGITMLGTCEAIALADRLGLDRQSLYDVVSTSSGNSWSMSTYCPAPGIGPASPADNDYRPGFAAELMLKDLRLSQQAADSADATTPMGALAREIYQRFVDQGDGRGRDFSAILQQLEKAATT